MTRIVPGAILLFLIAFAPPQARAQNQNPVAAGDASTTSPTAQDLGIFIEATPDDITLGDSVRLKLRLMDETVTLDRILTVEFAEENPENWAVVKPWTKDKDEQGKPAWQATLRAFDLDQQPLPETRVILLDAQDRQNQIEVQGKPVFVRSVRSLSSSEDLLGLKHPDDIPRDWRWVYATAAAALLALALGFFLYRRYANRATAPAAPARPAEPQLPPGIWAIEELDRRRRCSGLNKAPAKVIFTQVSEVIRLYIDRRWGVPAIDFTTLELMEHLKTVRMDEQGREWIRKFLDECDFVKFTKFEPSRERWATIWDDARMIVRITTPAEEFQAMVSGAAALDCDSVASAVSASAGSQTPTSGAGDR